MEDKPLIPESKVGYVRVPFPFAYGIACMKVMEGPEGTGFDGGNRVETTYSKQDIDQLLEDYQVQIDIPRTPWDLGNPDERDLFKTISEMQESSGASNLELTLNEAQALYAFGCTVRSEKADTGFQVQAAQGGIFDYPRWFIPAWASPIGVFAGDREHEVKRVAKKEGIEGTEKNQEKPGLNVLFTGSFDQFPRVMANNNVARAKPNEPLVFYSNQYEINEKKGKEGSDFTCTRLNTAESHFLFIKEEFFRECLIPDALVKLKQIDFTTESNESNAFNRDLKQSLMCFIPLLSNNEFAQLFFGELRNSAVKPETAAFLLEHIKLCFGERPIIWQQPESTFWQRHQSKIIAATICLLIAAAVIVSSVLTLGLSAVIAGMGGALIFGLATAFSSTALMAIGGVIGGYFDARREYIFRQESAVDPIAQMEGLIEAYRRDDKPGDPSLLRGSLTASTDSSILTSSFEKSERNIYSTDPFPPKEDTSPKPVVAPNPENSDKPINTL